MKECNLCIHRETCTPFEKQFDNMIYTCENFVDIDFEFDCSSDGYANKEGWKEFSWNKYTENILDYGEESDWDLFLLEQKNF